MRERLEVPNDPDGRFPRSGRRGNLAGMVVHVRLLGRFEVEVDGHTVPADRWSRRSAAQLVKRLALQPGHRLLRDQAIDALWPEVPLDKGLPRLHVAAHRARTALDAHDGVVLAGGVVSLFPDAELTLDVAEFERAVEAARTSGDVRLAEEAVAMYEGALLPDDLYEPWTEEPRERLRLHYREMLRMAGRYDDLVADDPLDEDAQLAMVRDLVRRGRRQDALRALDRMAELFERELGVGVSEAAVALRAEADALPVGEVPDASYVAATSPGRAALPAARTRLVGREQDLAEVDALLRVHRVVTISGPGGAGKSTLALAHARRVEAGDGEDGGVDRVDVVLAELAAARDAADVTRTVAEAAGVQGAGAVDATRLAATLGPRRLLLLLDNCEHLLDPSADLVDALLDAGTELRVLVTGREPLRVDGEVVHRLGSLGRDSAELFVERAVAAAGAGSATADDPKVVELCERLDGLPLAIELAAAQLRHLTLAELVDRLDERLALLVGGRPRAGERHSALATTIEWSYRLLSEESRQVFDLLGVFPADFDLDAVESVSGRHDRVGVTNVLGDLVAKSLLVHDRESGRYRLLETIRLFAVQQLQRSGDLEAAVERLRDHVVARATAAPRARTWMSASTAARSRDDLANVRLAFQASLDAGDLAAAVDIALGISTLWRNAVSYEEGRRWVAELLSRDLGDAERLWSHVLQADIALGSGSPRDLRHAAADATALAQQTDDGGAALVTGIYSAMAHLGDPAAVSRRLAEVAAEARAAGEPGLARLARGFRLFAVRMQGPDDGLADEVRDLLDAESGRDYDRYICLWGASLLALVDRDGVRLRGLMDAQITDLMTSGLRENWLTMYWGALALIAERRDFLPQLRRSRTRAADEGRQVEADCVLALAYAAACADEWERAAELLGAVAGQLLNDTAGFIHLALVRDQLVRPHLSPEAFAEATARGAALDVQALLRASGL